MCVSQVLNKCTDGTFLLDAHATFITKNEGAQKSSVRKKSARKRSIQCISPE